MFVNGAALLQVFSSNYDNNAEDHLALLKTEKTIATAVKAVTSNDIATEKFETRCKNWSLPGQAKSMHSAHKSYIAMLFSKLLLIALVLILAKFEIQ